MTDNKELIEAAETFKKYCDRQCKTCVLNFVCMNFFDYGTMYGFADSVVRILRRHENE